MLTNPINTAPLQQFIQQTQSAEASKSREVRLTIEQAKALSYTLGIVMSRLHGDLEKFVSAQAEKLQSEQVIEISMDSGEWK
jgi:hypothetical protein